MGWCITVQQQHNFLSVLHQIPSLHQPVKLARTLLIITCAIQPSPSPGFYRMITLPFEGRESALFFYPAFPKINTFFLSLYHSVTQLTEMSPNLSILSIEGHDGISSLLCSNRRILLFLGRALLWRGLFFCRLFCVYVVFALPVKPPLSTHATASRTLPS